ncbi:MAG: hypothetical protein HDT43_08065 [Ruminococcaceae bacterium]|nr:hypothetical protein [Oscillospiraceae bacterium]
MKRVLSILVCILVFICGCEKNEIHSEPPETNKIETVFSNENVTSFDINADGKIFFFTFGETGEFDEYSLPDGEVIREPIYRLSVSAEDEKNPRVLDEENAPAYMCVDGDSIYYPAYVRENNVESIVLFEYSLKDNSKENLHTYRDITFVKKMLLVNDKIFMLALDPSKYGNGETGDDYYNSGEVLSCFDLVTRTESVIWDTGAVEFGSYENKLVIYAHDNDGYFFVTCDTSTMEYSDKIPCDLGMIYAFAMCGENRYIYSGGENAFNDSCATMGSLSEKGKLDIVIGDVGIAGNVKCSNGRICFIDSAPQSETFGRLISADISSALRTDLSKFLTLAYSEDPSQIPSSMGFALNGKRLDAEELALTILSQDKDFDLFLFTSQDEFAYNAKNKGSFYPLNGIDGVEQYLNDCFPFIGKAMTDENGNIWALPISIRVDTLCYNADISERCGLNFSDNMPPDEFISAIPTAQSNELTYSVFPNLYSDLLLRDYLSRNSSFNTASFRELAEWIKTRIFNNEFNFSSGDDYYAALSSGEIGDIDFEFIGYPSDFERYSKIPSNRLARIPNFSEKNEAICTFICVNPFSANLNQALDYISLLAETLRTDEKNLCVSSLPVYKMSEFYSDLKSILDNGSISFRCPNEIYAESFANYIDGEITLDEFITEADRKLSAYLNE